VHGLIDENVHFRHTARLINALIGCQKHYELLLFPDERHQVQSTDVWVQSTDVWVQSM
jgi:dipeptidyl-peptidase-4